MAKKGIGLTNEERRMSLIKKKEKYQKEKELNNVDKTKTDKEYDKNTIYSIKKLLDHNIQGSNERKKIIENTLNDYEDFFKDYFENRFSVNLNQNQTISSNDKVCKGLESMADYLLFADEKNRKQKNKEIRQKIKDGTYNEKIDGETEEIVYNYFKDAKLFKKQSEEEFKKERVVDILVSGKNYKLEKTQNYCIDCNKCKIKCSWGDKLLEKGLPAPDADNEILAEYQQLINDCKEVNRFHMCNKIKKDQMIIKDKLKNTIYFKEPLGDTTKTDYFLFNFTNIDHLEAISKFPPDKLKNTENVDLSDIIIDYNNLLNKCKLNKKEKEILKDWRKKDSTQETIAIKNKTTQQSVYKLLRSINIKVAKQYKLEYEDWLYLNYLKGEYKQCSKCGEIKLVNKFDKDNREKDKLYRICKKCR